MDTDTAVGWALWALMNVFACGVNVAVLARALRAVTSPSCEEVALA